MIGTDDMSFLNNFKIVFKITLIVALMAAVTVGVVIYAASQVRMVDDAYSAVIEHQDKASMLTARANRWGETFLSAAYQLSVETSDQGNAALLAEGVEARKKYEGLMADVRKSLPQKAASIDAAVSKFQQAFTACGPAVDFASKTTSPDENMKAAAKLKAECRPGVRDAIAETQKLVDEFVAGAAKASDDLSTEVNSTIRMIWIFSGLGLVAGLAAALWIGISGLSRPIALLKAVMEAFANNNLTADVPGTERRDELGEMARTVEVFKKNGLEVERMRADQQVQEKRSAEQRKADMIRLANDFEGAVGSIIETVSAASTQLEASARTLSSTADRSQQQTTMVAAASEEASTNVQSVASATEELSSSVNEISRQVQDSARIASEAVGQARNTTDRVSELSRAAARIGDVVELINTIAGQTNLLALNATIEAARAGEAGRGFAVVASEVKALAEQTAKATGEIGQQISGIQAATQDSVTAIREISGTIEKLSEISSTIAAAVEEQGAATQEISRNVQQAAQGTHQVSSNIVDVQRGASETGSASSHVLTAARSLSGDSSRLKSEVGKFLNSVRAA
jgi:methyl-accepting chemotaxis protein